MFRDVTSSHRQNHRTPQAFLSLLTLIEALSTVTEQRNTPPCSEGEQTPPITLETAASSFADITNQVLDCKYVGVFALNPPEYRQKLLGVSGLSAEEEEHLRADTESTPLADYIDLSLIAQLQVNQVITIDLQKQPFMTTRSTHGARYRLVAPLMLHGQLMGLFTMAKTDELYPDIASAYTGEEIALIKGIARLAAQVIEKVRLLQERSASQANEQKLQEATRRYEDFLSTASHELRTPLTTIKGNVQLAQRRITTLQKQADQSHLSHEQLQRIELPLKETLPNFTRLERMIRELLDFSRIQANRFVMQKRPCNLVEIVRNTIEMVRQAVPERTFLLSLPAQEIVPLIVDADRISEVIQNYLSNAHKYSPLEQPIETYLTLEKTLARVAVHDHGAGILPEDQIYIWDRFYRAPDIATHEQGGSNSNLGLGLYLCKEIISLHHGQPGVQSTPGQGSTFWFTLTQANVAENCSEETR
jgi:signal transduction histidine kinase